MLDNLPKDRHELRMWSKTLLEKDAEPIDPQPCARVPQVVLKVDVLAVSKYQARRILVEGDDGDGPDIVLASDWLEEERIRNVGCEGSW